jgi:mono/diheme cytochrome c family protein
MNCTGSRSAWGRISQGRLIIIGATLALLVLCGAVPVRSPGDQKLGKQQFGQYCASCHHADAAGDGDDHSSHLPEPANLTLIKQPLPMFASIVSSGVPGTAMKPIPAAQGAVANLYAYVTQQPAETRREWERLWEQDQQSFPGSVENVYVTECAGCHGITGSGEGPWGKNDPHLWPKPANLRARNGEVGRLYYIIRHGIQGSYMPPQLWKIPDFMSWQLAIYVAQMADPKSTATIQAGTQTLYRNPNAWNDAAAYTNGEKHFNLFCAPCHNAHAMGTFLAPAMHERYWYYGGGTDNAMMTIISNGVPGQLMPNHSVLPEKTRWDVVTYIRNNGGLPDENLGMDAPPSSTQESVPANATAAMEAVGMSAH